MFIRIRNPVSFNHNWFLHYQVDSAKPFPARVPRRESRLLLVTASVLWTTFRKFVSLADTREFVHNESSGLCRFVTSESEVVSRLDVLRNVRLAYDGTASNFRQVDQHAGTTNFGVLKGSRRDQTSASFMVKMILAIAIGLESWLRRSACSLRACNLSFSCSSFLIRPSYPSCIPHLGCPSGRPFIRILPNIWIRRRPHLHDALSGVHNGARRGIIRKPRIPDRKSARQERKGVRRKRCERQKINSADSAMRSSKSTFVYSCPISLFLSLLLSRQFSSFRSSFALPHPRPLKCREAENSNNVFHFLLEHSGLGASYLDIFFVSLLDVEKNQQFRDCIHDECTCDEAITIITILNICVT